MARSLLVAHMGTHLDLTGAVRDRRGVETEFGAVFGSDDSDAHGSVELHHGSTQDRSQYHRGSFLVGSGDHRSCVCVC